MNIFFFVGSYYLRYIFIITLGLGLFFVGIDTLKFAANLPESANLLFLFFVYDFSYAVGYILPISLLLAEVVVLAVLLRNNEFVALLSLGYSKKNIVMPIFALAIIILLGFVGLNATPFAYAKEEVDRIVNQNIHKRYKGELFFKYQDSYVYFDKIYPFAKKAEDIRVYVLEDKKLLRLIQAADAYFIDNHWQLKDVVIIHLMPEIGLGKQGFQKEYLPTLDILEGFKPKILDVIYEKSGSVSIVDAFSLLHFLSNEQINAPKIRGILYALSLFPFFVLPVLVILIFKMPLSVRYGELTPYVFKSILLSLIVWGAFFALSRFSVSGFIHPEWSFVLPMCLWFGVGYFFFRKLNIYDH